MFKKVMLGTILSACMLNAAGYKIPEQSNDGLALGASNVAVNFGPDAAYYNPANMMFMYDSRHYFENTLAWFHIHPVKFHTNDGREFKSQKFDTMASTFHFVSPEHYENWRFGLSLAVPVGVGIGWSSKDAAFSGKRFKLKAVELNPTVAYRINDKLAVALGARAVYTKGFVATELYGDGYRHVHGDGINFGYNLALSYKPTDELSFAVTYRSKVSLKVSGKTRSDYNGKPQANGGGAGNGKVLKGMLDFYGKTKVNIPLPAQLQLATAYKLHDTTFMFAYERTFWSSFNGYDFEYNNAPNNLVFYGLYDKKIEKNYRDTNTFRFGIAHELNPKIRLMAGFVYDQKAAKNPYSVSFDLPDTKSYAYSAGINYKFSENLEFAFSGLYQDRQKSNASVKAMKDQKFSMPPQPTTLNGHFGDAKIWILSTGIKYKF